MDLGRAFGFITDDDSWVSTILLGGLILLIPIVGQLVIIGFTFEIARNVARGNPRLLPDWSNFGEKLKQGFYGFVISLVYSIPIIILQVLVQCITFALAGGASGVDENAAAGAAAIISLIFVPIILIVSIGVYMLIYAAWIRYIQTDSLGEALKFGEVIATVRAAPGTWGMLLLMGILCGLVGALGIIACGIGVLFTYVYGQAAFGHIMGQVLAREGGIVSGFDMPPEPAAPVY